MKTYKLKPETMKQAATNFNTRKSTTTREFVKIVVTPENDDKPAEFPSTPQTSHILNPPTIYDASHHNSSRNHPLDIIPQNLPTPSSGVPELGIVPTNNKGDNMCARNQTRGEHDWPNISIDGRTDQS